MLSALKNRVKAKLETGGGALSGKQLSVGSRTVKVDRLLGEGGFATIYRCTDVETGEVLALKHFLLTGYPEAERDVATEVGVMEALAGCPYVVRLHDAAFAGPPGAPAAAFVLMDYCSDTLVNFLQQRGWRLDDATLLRVFLPVCRAVAAMHSLQPPLAHRDLKAENVLQGPQGQWLLCDFGSVSARHGVLESARDIALEEEVVRRYTTPAYRAPELYDLYAREYIGPPVDIWALGVLLYLLAYGRLPFEGEAKLQVLNGRYTLPEGRPAPLVSLISSMLTVSPRDRPTIHQVLERLASLAPPDLWQDLPAAAAQQLLAQEPGAAGAAGAAVPLLGGGTGPAPAPHQRAASQGWADFASDGAPSPEAPGPHPRRQSGSGSWATFSPKHADAGPAAAAGAGAAASAGSFWSSFGEEAPAEAAQGQAEQALLGRLTQEDAAQLPPQLAIARPATIASQQTAQQAAQQPVQPRAKQAPVAPAAQQAAPATPPNGASEASPLSAGLTRFSQGPFSSAASVTKPPAPAAAAASPAAPSSRGSAASAAGPLPGPPAAAAVPGGAQAGGGGGGGGVEAELREHCQVLEQLLEVKTREVHSLQKLAEQQAAEIRQLRERVQRAEQAAVQQQQQPGATPAGNAGAASSSTPASSRLAVQVPGDTRGGSSWTSFGVSSGGERDPAPTPTLLQPGGGVQGSVMRRAGSSSVAESSSVAAAGAGAAAGAAATPASRPVQIEEALRAKLDLSSSGLVGQMGTRSSSGSAATPLTDQRQPMRGAGMGNGAAGSATTSQAGNGGVGNGQLLQSHPVQLTPASTPHSDGSRSAPVSTRASPISAASMAAAASANGAMSPAHSGSPRHSRPGSNMSGRSLSPAKHRRNLTAPNGGFFEDLDPLH